MSDPGPIGARPRTRGGPLVEDLRELYRDSETWLGRLGVVAIGTLTLIGVVVIAGVLVWASVDLLPWSLIPVAVGYVVWRVLR